MAYNPTNAVEQMQEAARKAYDNFYRNRPRPQSRRGGSGRGYTRRRPPRNSWEYLRAKSIAMARAGYQCQHGGCDMHGPGNVEVAHKIPVWLRPDLANDPNNMIVLCLCHHDLFDGRKPRRGGKNRFFHNDRQYVMQF